MVKIGYKIMGLNLLPSPVSIIFPNPSARNHLFSYLLPVLASDINLRPVQNRNMFLIIGYRVTVASSDLVHIFSQ